MLIRTYTACIRICQYLLEYRSAYTALGCRPDEALSNIHMNTTDTITDICSEVMNQPNLAVHIT